MLDSSSLQQLKGKKNLLAFSAGVDSTALFFLLLQHNIKFDIATVNYNTREQSLEELEYAKELASTHNLESHILSALTIEKNFEAEAREIRYDFFEELITKYKYDNLLTAHHLGDRFEWMLMQFCKGAGCAEIAGMKFIEDRSSYKIIRPLLGVDKQELLNFLNHEKIKYFIDESNFDEDIKRNSFRHNHTSPLLKKYLSGIKKSFEYLDADREELIEEIEIQTLEKLAYFKSSNSKRNSIFHIDKYLKSQLYMLSANEREQLKGELNLVVGREFIVVQTQDTIFIAPYLQNIVMSKEFKERCRVLKIEPKLRPYLYKNKSIFAKVKELLC